MTRNRLNQAKHRGNRFADHMGNGNHLTLSKAHGLILEDNYKIDMKDTYQIKNVHPPIDEKMLLTKSIVIITYYPLLIK